MKIKEYLRTNKVEGIISVRKENKSIGIYNLDDLKDMFFLLEDCGDFEIIRIEGNVIYIK